MHAGSLADLARRAAEQLPEARRRLANLGAEPMPMTPEKYDAFIQQQYDELGKVMRAAAVRH